MGKPKHYPSARFAVGLASPMSGKGPEDQMRNTRRRIMARLGNKTLPIKTWCEVLRLDYRLVHGRIRALGWDPRKALLAPKRGVVR